MQLILAVPKKKTAHATHLYNNYFLHLYYHIQFSVFEGRPRSKQTIEATAGAVTGEATFEGDNADNIIIVMVVVTVIVLVVMMFLVVKTTTAMMMVMMIFWGGIGFVKAL